ncbi:hypothetical protein PUNSTDRAFT_140772 [Punctularia strigosozonata HHB-11173 SS5]|uniref:uncharacterized protein n=1 Tax=Punctularia strigosozonata (strain HHB-11173) TaxID=741275 RepID=UPI0004416253|nr:uncharacterized protein PUNSTDRAFT_140772 [Punctularia strigosozonata HHB-11173 SS5]EIN14491.1 hypothetical protein PUNSTDRAFT_140772 [Punctularia strigosozonata HHB-11173 SS5]
MVGCYYLSALLVSTLALSTRIRAAPSTSDPCTKVAGLTFVPPNDALACLKAFPFNETLKDNVLGAVARVFDFYTFEDWYLNSPAPFQDSTANIRAEIAKINATKYETDYDFNRAIWNFTTRLNDGHTRWFPSCYDTYQNLLPAPVVILEENGAQNVFVIPDSVDLVPLVGANYTAFFDSIGFNWQRLAGAKVLEIEGLAALDYIDLIADTISGNYLDHGVRVNSVLSSYRIVDTDFSQRFGDLGGPPFPDQESLTFKLIPANSTKEETVTVPYLASFGGVPFTDSASYWANNCAATDATNGEDFRTTGVAPQVQSTEDGVKKRLARGVIVDKKGPANGVGLPNQFVPGLPAVNGSEGVIKSYILPGNKTGVMFVGSFEPDDFVGFQTDVQAATAAFKKAGVSQLIIDLSNNGGGFVCLGQFLHQFLAGSRIGYPGFQTTNRANTLAKKVVRANIALNLSEIGTFYNPVNWAFLNDTEFPPTHNYIDPPNETEEPVNGQIEKDAQRFHDICTPFNIDMPRNPPFDLNKVAIVGNGNCASTCSMFSTLMFEHYHVKIATFGGKPGETLEYKGMAGNQVLEFSDLKSEIKTAGLNGDPLAPPDLLIDGDMRWDVSILAVCEISDEDYLYRVNWRTAWSFLDELRPIAYVSEPSQFRFPYTKDTYNNPLKLWTFAESQLFK